MKKLILITLIAVALFSTSCTKTGGNADMSTVDFTVYGSDWIEYGTFGQPQYGFAVDLAMPEITSNVIQYGMVTLYMKTGESWTPVPFNIYKDGYQGGFYYKMSRGIFSIDYLESDQQTIRPDSQIFRLVIVQPI